MANSHHLDPRGMQNSGNNPAQVAPWAYPGLNRPVGAHTAYCDSNLPNLELILLLHESALDHWRPSCMNSNCHQHSPQDRGSVQYVNMLPHCRWLRSIDWKSQQWSLAIKLALSNIVSTWVYFDSAHPREVFLYGWEVMVLHHLSIVNCEMPQWP